MDRVFRIGTIPTHPGGDHRVSIFVRAQYGKGSLSITGVIGPTRSGNSAGGAGQIDMEFAHRDPADNDKRFKDNLIKPSEFKFAEGWDKEKWLDLLDIWKRWHLNDMQAACKHQRKLGWTYSTHKGQRCPECNYEIGTEWRSERVPASVLKKLKSFPDADRQPAWV